ncbi:MAG: serine/threonine protein kinase, partial [Myxococcales bacterium]|nr:serine/threonine protein kinase [Myxococcales bacterium]
GDTPTGSVYFVMEYLEGRDLKALLQQTGPLPWPRARHLLLQILAALEAAHAQRIIHRDIKPANCLVVATKEDPEQVKLLDFGIAKVTADPTDQSNSLANSLTNTGEVFGTVKYMAPEQATGVSDDPRSDMYSVGIVAYEMLTGQVPFSGPFAFQIISRHVHEPPRPPRELVARIPPAAEAFVLRALAKQPEHRFGSMGEMRRALAAIPADAEGATEVVTPAATAVGAAAAQPGATVRMTGSHPGVSGVGGDSSRVTTRPRASWSFGAAVAGLLVAAGSLALLATRPWSSGEASPKAAALERVPASARATTGPPEETAPPDRPRGTTSDGSAATAAADASTTEGPSASTSGAEASTSEEAGADLPPSRPPRRTTKRKPPKALTDDDVRSRLIHSIDERCASLGRGERPTIDLVVGSGGDILNSRVKGASATLEQCVREQLRRTTFPSGTTRRITLRPSL